MAEGGWSTAPGMPFDTTRGTQSMKLPLLWAMLFVSLAGCGPTAEEQRAMDAQRCAGFGNAPGTEAFANCLMGMSQQREAEGAADRRAAAARDAEDRRAREAQAAKDKAAADRDAETRRNITRGEAVENEEARKAGFGPSPTQGMNCTTTTSSSGSANNRTTTSSTTCH